MLISRESRYLCITQFVKDFYWKLLHLDYSIIIHNTAVQFTTCICFQIPWDNSEEDCKSKCCFSLSFSVEMLGSKLWMHFLLWDNNKTLFNWKCIQKRLVNDTTRAKLGDECLLISYRKLSVVQSDNTFLNLFRLQACRALCKFYEKIT